LPILTLAAVFWFGRPSYLRWVAAALLVLGATGKMVDDIVEKQSLAARAMDLATKLGFPCAWDAWMRQYVPRT